MNMLINFLKTQSKILINQSKTVRKLEMGPGSKRIDGFETLDIISGKNVDYVLDVSKRLPFKDNSFDIVYSSHVLEHIPWYQTEEVIQEWVRIIKPNGVLEIWVPDGLKICQVILDNSMGLANTNYKDGWLKKNPREDPFIWANGRLFYGLRDDYPSWHKAIFTAKSLIDLFKLAGLVSVRELSFEENRANLHHGWINLGVCGVKP